MMKSKEDDLEPSSIASRSSLKRRLVLLVVFLVLGAVLLEITARVRLYLKFNRSTTEMYSKVFHEGIGAHVPVPNQTFGETNFNSLGFRGPEIELPKPDGRFRIAFLGGSTTLCADIAKDELTWPALTCQMLEEHFPDTQFDYINGGATAYNARHSLPNLTYRVKHLDPDLVIITHASNDLTELLRPLAVEQGLFIGNSGRTSALGKISVAWDLIEKNLKISLRKNTAASGENTLTFDLNKVALQFHDRMQRLVQTAANTAPLVAVATYPTRFRIDQSPDELIHACRSSFYYMPYMTSQSLLASFDQFNRVTREVSELENAVLIDGEDEIPADDVHFKDSIHFTANGCQKMAERVVKRLLENEAFVQLVNDRRSSR